MAGSPEEASVEDKGSFEGADKYAGLGREDEPDTYVSDAGEAEAQARASDHDETALLDAKRHAEALRVQEEASTNELDRQNLATNAENSERWADRHRYRADAAADIAGRDYRKSQEDNKENGEAA